MTSVHLPPACRGSHQPPLGEPTWVDDRLMPRGVCRMCGETYAVRLDGLVLMHRTGVRRR